MTRGWTRRRAITIACWALALVALVWVARLGWAHLRQQRDLEVRVSAIQPPRSMDAQPCVPRTGPRPLVLLVLGQSNAGNHGAEDERVGPASATGLSVFTGRGCASASDPLPGGTGRHASIWSRLPGALAAGGLHRPVVVALLAVESTSIADWADLGGPLGHRLIALLDALEQAGVQPDAVLWQQGEADALGRTTATEYFDAFARVRAVLRGRGVAATILAARSTRCRQAEGQAVRQALDRAQGEWADVRMGADTDALSGPSRLKDCHFSGVGLDLAAQLWAQVLIREFGHLP